MINGGAGCEPKIEIELAFLPAHSGLIEMFP